MSDRDEIIRTATVATLRQVAGWVTEDSDQAMFYDTANAVERIEPEGWTCCPVCEEITCDEGCPLEPIRLDYERREREESYARRAELRSGLSRESNPASTERLTDD